MNGDTYSYVLQFLSIKDIITCSVLNKLFHNIAKSESLWKNIFVSKFNNNIFKFNYYETCKLINLQSFQLYNNNIFTLPKEMVKLTNIRNIFMSNNPVTISHELSHFISYT